jgi:diguanylate cyclase (GGDEF)-like protein/PAS domain S-box-containing protein
VLINIISIYLFFAVVTTIFLVSYVQSRNGASYIRVMFFLGFAVSIYMYGYSCEINAVNFEQALFWNQFQYIGIPFVSALWLTIALMYTGYFFPAKRWLLVIVYLIPIITFLARLTNDYHYLYFSSISFKMVGNRLLLIKRFGPLNYLQVVHSMSMILISLYLFISAYIKKLDNNRMKLIMMLGVSFFAITGLLLSTVNPIKELNIDYMVILLPLTVIIVALSIIRYDFLEIKTIARNIIFEKSSDSILLINNDGIIVDYNPAAKKFFNYIDIQIQEMTLQQHFKGHKKLMEALKKDENSTIELVQKGEVKYYTIITEHVSNISNDIYGRIKTIRDITEHFRSRQNLIKQATIDELSGLLNRNEFMKLGNQLLKNALIYNSKIYLLMIDIDHFKDINDNYGHLVGDEVIKTLGLLFRQNFRGTDIVARIGGEEFAIIMEGCPYEVVQEKAELLRKKVHMQKNNIENYSFNISISIGITGNNESSLTLNDLIHRADLALYTSKRNGRNRVTCSKE